MSDAINTTPSGLTSLTRRLSYHWRIVSALFMREIATRYGRENIGFLWVIGEPLIFAVAVTIMWSIIRPKFEHGINVAPFTVTGYMPMILLRHVINHGLLCVQSNTNLLYHRRITLLHLFIARGGLEIIGVSLAFIVCVVPLTVVGLMPLPASLGLVFAGWFILAAIAFGLTLILGSISALYEGFEKFGMVLSYIMIPMTGAFWMVAWLPYQYRSAVLKIPFVNCIEAIRAGFFGEFVPTYFNLWYALYWAGGFIFLGLILLRFVRSRLDVE